VSDDEKSEAREEAKHLIAKAADVAKALRESNDSEARGGQASRTIQALLAAVLVVLTGGGVTYGHLSATGKIDDFSERQAKHDEALDKKVDAILLDLAGMKERATAALRDDLPKRMSAVETRLSVLEAQKK
jgi:hypothetical protein